MQPQFAGLPWFERDDYEAFRSVLPARKWHRTFDEWLAAAEQTKQRLQRSGIVAVEAHVRSDTFVEWCKSTGRNVDTQALLDFGNDVAYRTYLQQQAH